MSNDPKLIELTHEHGFKSKVNACLDELTGKGFDPKIAEASRTQRQQDEKVRLGYSKTRKSKHVGSRYPDNRSRAADIVEKAHGWNSSRAFWLTLGRVATLHGLEWGGLWFGKGPIAWLKRRRLEKFLLTSPQPFYPALYGGPLGWDVAHIESKHS